MITYEVAGSEVDSDRVGRFLTTANLFYIILIFAPCECVTYFLKYKFVPM